MIPEKILRFKTDTKHRKDWFTGVSFSHPAKMSLPLQLWLIENFTKPGETILDPMAGSGTVLVACSMGRNVIAVELEIKFVDIMKGNWQKIQQRGPMMGYQFGQAQILQGDSRNLEGVLFDDPAGLPDVATEVVDTIISSPPYAETLQGSGADAARKRIAEGKYKGLRPDVWISKGNVAGSTFGDGYSHNPANLSNLPYGKIDQIITSPPYAESNQETSNKKRDWDIGKSFGRQLFEKIDNPSNIGNLSYGSIDSVITSPPYAEMITRKPSDKDVDNEAMQIGGKLFNYNPNNPDNIGNLPYGDISAINCILSSPPYEGVNLGSDIKFMQDMLGKLGRNIEGQSFKQYNAELSSNNIDNIGNLKSQSYLDAMLQVYQGCYRVLRSGGTACIITKNFIREQKEVRLDLDTIALCEQAGFVFQERWYRELPAQSFWRILYKRRFPDAPQLNFEDVLVFRKLEALT